MNINRQKTRQKTKDQRFIASLLLLSFFLAETTLVPTVFSFPINPPVAARENLEQGIQSQTVPEVQLFEKGLVFINQERETFHEVRMVEGLYVLEDSNDPDFLEVIERLPEGGFGRLLRYRGQAAEGKRVDLEFIYEDREKTVTILDYEAGRFFRTTFTESQAPSFALFPLKDKKGLVEDFIASYQSSLKGLLAGQKMSGWTLPESRGLHSQFESLSEKDIWVKRHVRGPPAEGALP